MLRTYCTFPGKRSDLQVLLLPVPRKYTVPAALLLSVVRNSSHCRSCLLHRKQIRNSQILTGNIRPIRKERRDTFPLPESSGRTLHLPVLPAGYHSPCPRTLRKLLRCPRDNPGFQALYSAHCKESSVPHPGFPAL